MSAWESVGKSDEWYTPQYVFDALGVEFDLDVASPYDRAHCCVPAKEFISEFSLEKKWKGFVWMNPPFGGRNSLERWLNKLQEHGNGIALTPDRSSATWWQKAASECDSLMMISGKVKFVRPDGSIGLSPGTGTTLFAYGQKATQSLLKAQENGLGIVFRRSVYA